MASSAFVTIAQKYLESLESALREASDTGEFTPELSYRPFLDSFFRELSQNIDPSIGIIFEPRNQSKAGRPDWRFYNETTMGVYGYVEAKGLDAAALLQPNEHSDQLHKYLDIGHKVMLTDGVDFAFFDPTSTSPKLVSLVEKPFHASGWGKAQPNPLFERQFRDFVKNAGFRTCSEDDLVREMAKRAKALSENAQKLVTVPKGAGMDEHENRTINVLHDLKGILEKQHDSLLQSSKVFGDFIAQVLIFGLLYAHRIVGRSSDDPKDNYQKIQNFWSNSLYQNFTEHLKPFRALAQLLGSELESLGPLGTWYEDSRLLLAHVKIREKQNGASDYHLLFEKFLTTFDPKTRFDFGAFYTPRPLATYSVKLAQAIVDAEFRGKTLYEDGNKLIDPCCGTGSFLEELITGANGNPENPLIIGFEILPAPYALAHYRLSMIGKGGKYPDNLSIILTNTLSDDLETRASKQKTLNLIQSEQERARKLAQPPITLVIGNPPCSDSAEKLEREKTMIIQKLIEDFRPPKIERAGRQNIQKQSQNEFVKFLRWSCEKIRKSPAGLFVLVLPSSFAEHPSHLYARKWLLRHFAKIWCMDLDLDARTGTKADNIFNTLQGRILLVGLKTNESLKESEAKIYYASIADLGKKEKIDFLKKEKEPSKYLQNFSSFRLSEKTCAFRPGIALDQKIYESFWKLFSNEGKDHCIFERHCSGLKLAPSALFVHANRQILLRRSGEIADAKNNPEQLISRWYTGQDKPPSKEKFSQNIRKAIGENLSEKNVIRYAYRPFLSAYAFISEPVLSEMARTGGGGTRYRPEVLSAFRAMDVRGIAIAPATKDIGEKLHRFASFCWHLPDNDLCKRGNAHIFCNRFPSYKKVKKGWNPEPIQNINENSLELIRKTAGKISEESLLYYVYGVLCSNAYLKAFEGVLFTVAGSENWPRIPVARDKTTFIAIVDMGKQLAELENIDFEVKLTRNSAKLEKIFEREFRLTDYDVKENEGILELIEDKKTLIKFAPLPEEVLSFEVAGYNVLAQWLKFHSHRYTRASFGKADFEKLLSLLSRIELQLKTMEELDREIAPLLTGEAPLL